MQSSAAIDQREDRRSNIFVIATLYSASGSSPVRVRNMSRNGALIEGAVLPPVGSPVRLARGSLCVSGEVIRTDGRHAGLHFAASTTVADWLPSGKGASSQQLADEMAHHARLGALSKSAPEDPSPSLPPMTDLHEQLTQVARSLERAGETLAGDTVVAAVHAGPLQAVDVAAQMLLKLAASVSNAAPAIKGSAVL